jgi:23S rRNA (cytidine1920-2'-O)/16S rRNA (cytidine1409-2'-O)-methyltransferase
MQELENIIQERLDVLLCNISGYSREFAKELIAKGDVFVDGKKLTKPGVKVSTTSQITYTKPTTAYVSRAGYKLEKALSFFALDVCGKNCVDIGASTGGFTDCMLQNGAKHIYAIDSGTDQLVNSLLTNPKVTSLEKTNIKNVTPSTINTLCSFASVDVSFISLTKVLQPIKILLEDNACIVTLIKPQFELDKKTETRKGIVKDKKKHIKVLTNIYSFALSIGLTPINATFSPLRGSDGNIEYLMYIKNSNTIKNIDISINLTTLEKIVDSAFDTL